MLQTLRTIVRWRPVTVAFISVIVLLAGAAIGGYGYALRQWQAAQKAVKEGRLADAGPSLNVCLFVWPRSVSVHLLAARAARLKGDFRDAEAHLNRCLQLQSGSKDDIQLEFLLLRVQDGEVDEVAPNLWNCVRSNHPESALILKTLSRSYMHDLRYGPALTCLDRWVEEVRGTPAAAEPLYYRGWILEFLHASAEAMNAYQEAIKADPDYVPVRLRVAEILLEKANPPEALAHLERLRQQCPDRPDVMARLGQCYFMMGRTDEARPLLEAAAARLPDDPTVLIQLAKLDLEEARAPEAETLLRHILKANPFDVEAEYSLGACLQAQGRPQEAAATLDDSRSKKAVLDRVDRLLGDLTLGRSSADPDTVSELGTDLLRVGQDNQGVYWLNQALQQDPANKAAHKALAEYFERKGDHDQAAAHRRFLASPSRPTPAH
jgi:tetratricopeptide (TPR) repeat protein